MADSSLYQQFLRPVKSVAQYQDEADAREANQQQNAIQRLLLQEKAAASQSAADDRNALQRAASAWNESTTPDQRITSLRGTGRAGLMDRADAMEKQLLERRKAEADLGQKQRDSQRDSITQVLGFTTPQHAASDLDAAVQRGEIPAHIADALKRSIPTDPVGMKDWKLSVVQGLLNPEKLIEMLKPVIQTRNTGGATDTLAVDPLTGRATVTGSVRNTQSPDSIASTATAVRGQNMADARARELAQQQRETTAQTRADKAAEKKAQADERSVTKYAATLQKEGIPEVEQALASAENLVGNYAEDIPGYGRAAGALPSWALGDEGNNVRQAVAAVRNIVLSARSGAAVTDQELRRLTEELGAGALQSEEALRQGLRKFRQRFEAVKANAAAGVGDDVKDAYEANGGVRIKRGGGGAPDLSSTRQTPTVPGRGAASQVPDDIQALLHKHGGGR
ncbi:MAG: hypothetical protein KIH64_007160 [Mycobacterium sp.]|nr:hypothetical protein [Mycobacterium sp.]